jgi:hypothetical protein
MTGSFGIDIPTCEAINIIYELQDINDALLEVKLCGVYKSRGPIRSWSLFGGNTLTEPQPHRHSSNVVFVYFLSRTQICIASCALYSCGANHFLGDFPSGKQQLHTATLSIVVPSHFQAIKTNAYKLQGLISRLDYPKKRKKN